MLIFFILFIVFIVFILFFIFSPHREHCALIHTPLTASPSLCEISPFMTMPPSTSLSIPEENSMANRFFTLQKEGERRITLASLMQEHENEV